MNYQSAMYYIILNLLDFTNVADGTDLFQLHINLLNSVFPDYTRTENVNAFGLYFSQVVNSLHLNSGFEKIYLLTNNVGAHSWYLDLLTLSKLVHTDNASLAFNLVGIKGGYLIYMDGLRIAFLEIYNTNVLGSITGGNLVNLNVCG